MAPRLFLPLAFAPLAVFAQPVLDHGTSATLPGESYLYHACPWQDPGAAGAGQTWDLSSLTTDSLIAISFVDPAGTPDAASFPTATIAADDGGAYAYSSFTSSGGEFLGMSVPGETPIVYSDPMTQVVFPATYNTAWTDGFGGNFTFGGFPVARSGSITATCDAYGTLILPWGSVSDVLRVSHVEDYQDVSIVTATGHREYTYFLAAGTHYPLVHLFSFTTTVLGNSTTITGAQWMDGTTTQVGPVTDADGVLAYPVPANETLTVRCAVQGSIRAILTDARGRTVLEHDVRASSSLRMDTHALPAGVYTLRTWSGTGVSARPVVVVH